jgi:ferrous iron transport protein A
MTFLSKLNPGQRARVVGYSEDSPLVRRLTELGLIPGREVVYVRKAPLRDPLEVQVGACYLSLRHADASLVAVELED